METVEGARVGLTYDVVYEVVRREKLKAELQSLEPGFLDQLHGYIRDKEAELLNTPQDNAFSSGSRGHLQLQLHNVRRLIKELYDRREKKIVAMAQNRSKMRQDLVDTSHLLPHERELYHELVGLLTERRRQVLTLGSRSERPRTPVRPPHYPSTLPSRRERVPEPAVVDTPEPEPTSWTPEDSEPALDAEIPAEAAEPEVAEQPPHQDYSEDVSQPESPEEPSPELESEAASLEAAAPGSLFTETEPVPGASELQVRFLADTPEFIGSNLESYGPFQANETAQLPADVAHILVKQGSVTLLDDAQ